MISTAFAEFVNYFRLRIC